MSIRRTSDSIRRRQSLRKEYEALPERGKCPRPDKKVYNSRQHAKLAIRQVKGTALGGSEGRVRAYLCQCGRWHIGRLTGKETR